MKIILKLFGIITIAFLLFGCSHKHDFFLSKDEIYHYDKCECGKIKNKVEHSFSWIIDKEAEIGVAGEKHISCIKCGEVMETATIDPLTEESGTEPNPDDPTSPEGGETGTEPGENETNPPITNNDNIIDSIADKFGVTSEQLLIIAGGSLAALVLLIIVIVAIKRKRC